MDEGFDRREWPARQPNDARRERVVLFARTLGPEWIETEPGVYRLADDLAQSRPAPDSVDDDP